MYLSRHLLLKMWTRTLLRKAIELLREWEYWALVHSPNDYFDDAWDYHHYKILREKMEQMDLSGFHLYLFHECGESYIMDRVAEQFSKHIPRMWQLVLNADCPHKKRACSMM